MVRKGGLPAPAGVGSPESAVAKYAIGTGWGDLYSARLDRVGFRAMSPTKQSEKATFLDRLALEVGGPRHVTYKTKRKSNFRGPGVG